MEHPASMGTKHTTLGKVLHWGFLVLYAYGIFKQIDDLSELEDTALLLFEIAFATLFLVIVMLRYAYMHAALMGENARNAGKFKTSASSGESLLMPSRSSKRCSERGEKAPGSSAPWMA